MNLREQAVIRAATHIWEKTRCPVTAGAIAEATGFDAVATQRNATQQILNALDLKGFFSDVLRRPDRFRRVLAGRSGPAAACSRPLV
ncbi:hypothetical protein [Mycobacterium montefiorense]|uniref:hypothetical protein n=1 Tax=Mycobacterium montefiorense TaxID=154654 RepID=UPI00105780B1|nr:hypothetical protein [Mycobacterium montefiorense]